MDSVLMVSRSEKAQQAMKTLLQGIGLYDIVVVSSGSEARQKLGQFEFGLVLVHAPLPDEFGHELAIMAAETSLAGVVMVVKHEIEDEVSARVEDYGILTVGLPTQRPAFYQSVKLITATRNRMLGLRRENVQLHKKIEEIRLVDRAKCALIQYLSLTEQQAHRHIEKQAMDLRLTKRQIAESILRTYES